MRYVQCVSRSRHRAYEYWFELLVAALAVAGMLELILLRSPGAPTSSKWFAVPAAAVLLLVLLTRRWFPFGAPAAYWILAAALSFIDGMLIPAIESLVLVGLASAALLGNLPNARQAWTGLAIVLAGITAVVYNIPSHTTGELILIPVEFGIAWAAGFALRERAEQAEAAEERATHAELTATGRGRRGARADRPRAPRHRRPRGQRHGPPGRHRQAQPPPASEDHDLLRGVERAGRTALAEMRRLLAAMRREGDEAELSPQPGLDGLDSLLDEVGRAGLPVELHVDGTPFPLPRGIDLSAYRIVQEGLTNALKHAHASDADVTVRYRPDELEIEVRDNGQGSATNGGLGHGLIGIRERVMIYGGRMTAGTSVDGGFVLTTRLPLAEDER